MYALNVYFVPHFGNNMQKIYVFDLDGTLVDSMELAVDMVLAVLDEYNVPYERSIVKILTPLGFKGIAKYYSEELGVPLTPDEIYAVFTERLGDLYAEKVSLKSGVKQTLAQLKARGARINVLTASPHIFTDVCLRNNGVFDWFENVWSAEDFAMLKSDARIYGEVAKRLGVSASDCIMVDDSYHVLQVAQGAGMKTIGVYEPFSADVAEDIKNTADRYAENFLDILRMEI